MDRTSTLPRYLRRYLCLTLTLLLIISALIAQAQPVQRVYANNQNTNVTGQPSVSLNAAQTALLNVALSGPLLNTLARVENPDNAKDADPRTRSSLFVTAANIDLLPLTNVTVGGVAEQTLLFTGSDLPTATTPVSIKVGTGSSLAGLLDGITIQAVNSGVPVGPVFSQSNGNLAAVSNGPSQQEITIVPGVPYNGVRIRLAAEGGLLTVGVESRLDIYHAYFLKPASGINCDAPIDALGGINGTVVAFGGVFNEFDAIDGDPATYATLTSGANLIGDVRHTTIFPGASVAGDTVRFTISVPGTLVQAQLLTGISVESFNGTTSNGVVDNSSGLLQLQLLDGSTNSYTIQFVPSGIFDRVTLRLGGVLNALATIRLHEVSRIIARPGTSVNSTAGAAATVCTGTAVNLAVTDPQPGVTYTWYTVPTGGSGTAGATYSPGVLAPGTYTFYVNAMRAGCTNASGRNAVVVTVTPAGVVAAINVNGTPGGAACINGAVTATINVTSTGITSPVYYLYNGPTLVASNTTGIFTVPVTAGASYTYSAGVSGTGLCETLAADRKSVSFTINPLPAAPVLTQTGTITVQTGGTLLLNASSPDAASYAWYKDGVLLPAFTGATLQVTNATAADAGVYTAEAVSAAGCRSLSAATTVVIEGFQ
ncbi:hypothetical protein GS398_18790, partial [Pedobacter sp. HMF7056]